MSPAEPANDCLEHRFAFASLVSLKNRHGNGQACRYRSGSQLTAAELHNAHKSPPTKSNYTPGNKRRRRPQRNMAAFEIIKKRSPQIHFEETGARGWGCHPQSLTIPRNSIQQTNVQLIRCRARLVAASGRQLLQQHENKTICRL